MAISLGIYPIFRQIHISGHMLWGYSLTFRPKNRPKIYGIGTSNQSVPEMAIDIWCMTCYDRYEI